MKKVINSNLINIIVKIISIAMFFGILSILIFIDTRIKYNYLNTVKNSNYIYLIIIFLTIIVCLILMKLLSKKKEKINSAQKNYLLGEISYTIKKFLEKVNSQGYKMCILTTSEKSQAVGALKRTGVLDLFDEVYTDRDFNLSKKDPQIYIKACEKMGESPSDTVVFEDALYAVESAKKTKCVVVGVYDEYSKGDWDKIISIADKTIQSF